MDDRAFDINHPDEFAFDGVQAHETVYGGIKIDADRKAQLERQPAADFLAFDPTSKEDEFIMRYKLPEKGLAGKNEINIRENVNYLRRGIARLCLDKDGNIDFSRFDDFYDKYDSNNMDAYMDAYSEEFGIPKEKRETFKAFMRLTGAYVADIEIKSFLAFKISMRQTQIAMNELYKPDQPVDREKEKLLLNSYPDFCNAMNNLRKLANIDPETETHIYNTLDCGMSASLNRNLLKYVNKYRNGKGLEPIETPEEGRQCSGGKMDITISEGRPDKPENGNFNTFNSHACFVVNAKLNDKPVLLSMETTAPPTGKLLFNPSKGENGMGIYKDTKELKNFHMKDSWIHIEHSDKFLQLKSIREDDFNDVKKMTGSHVLEMKLRTAARTTNHTMDELSKRISSWSVDHPLKVSSAEFTYMKESLQKVAEAKTPKEKNLAMNRLNYASQLYLNYKDPKGDAVKEKALSDYAKKRLDFARDVLEFSSAELRKAGIKPAVLSELKVTGELKKAVEAFDKNKAVNKNENKSIDTVKKTGKAKGM